MLFFNRSVINVATLDNNWKKLKKQQKGENNHRVGGEME